MRTAVSALCAPWPSDLPLYPCEEAAIGNAVLKRRAEFAAGRASAREALARFGARLSAIHMSDDRSPVWPDGFVGSISHCETACGAAVARSADFASIGIDIEPADALEPDLDYLVRTDEERASSAPARAGADWAKIAFSAKEACFKCFFPLIRRQLDFHDIAITFSSPSAGTGGVFHARFLSDEVQHNSGLEVVEGRWAIERGLILCAVALPKAWGAKILSAHASFFLNHR